MTVKTLYGLVGCYKGLKETAASDFMLAGFWHSVQVQVYLKKNQENKMTACNVSDVDNLFQQDNTGRFIMFSVITNIYNKKTIAT
jgi:hypothetical protein